MAFKKIFAQRFPNITKISSQTLTNCRISSSSVHVRIPSSTAAPDIAPDPGDNAIFRRFLHRGAGSVPPFSPKLGESLVHKLKEMDIVKNRLRFDGLPPPLDKSDSTEAVNAEDARKLLKVAQLELVKSRLREIRNTCILYSEFHRICEGICSDPDQATQIAKMLDDSATVVRLGDVVFLRPEQVAKAIQNLFPVVGVNEAQTAMREELEEMEKEKAVIDGKADRLVRRELWGGLGFMVLQTAAFMRLTFWELSWDVMEPICFFVTSTYFMAGFTFFLRTSTEPTFEGYYKSRFIAKQKRLMKRRNFDIARYNELRAACPPDSSSFPSLLFQKSYPQ
ncbi:calcium uniporter protein 2, mitochondrial-like [Senna tora]|uniref:Calcium uniporter protein 2, mitochondrial-like n=1 Tax=Senna tora TaxID=362788 RepID=A0A834TV99_9FABA|nr:calcium uniporter protein 2, mitochondrial-like [Senna tora]